MAAVLFQNVFKQGRIKGYQAGDVMIRDWFRDKALSTTSRNIKPERILNRRAAMTNKVDGNVPIGKLLFYKYDPKHKATLPYYDTFPMVFPIELYDDGFLGINLHYLPPTFRARLMDALYDTLNNEKYNEKSRLKITYDLLKRSAKLKYFKPCLKRYLTGHIRSQVVSVPIEEWDYAIFLPTARFQKMNQRKVWDESVRKIMAG